MSETRAGSVLSRLQSVNEAQGVYTPDVSINKVSSKPGDVKFVATGAKGNRGIQVTASTDGDPEVTYTSHSTQPVSIMADEIEKRAREDGATTEVIKLLQKWRENWYGF